MNKKITFLQILFVVLLATISGTNLFAQEKTTTELGEFLIFVETTDSNELKLKCTEGCAWKTLTFNLSNMDRIQAIDEFGMTDTKTENKTHGDLSDFLITVQRTDNGLSLKGVNGTAWTDLSFSLKHNLPQAIDEIGMTE